MRCRATFDPATDLYGAVTQSFRRPVRTEPAATAVLLDETHHLLSVHGRQELRDMRQHQIAAEKGVDMAETRQREERDVWQLGNA